MGSVYCMACAVSFVGFSLYLLLLSNSVVRQTVNSRFSRTSVLKGKKKKRKSVLRGGGCVMKKIFFKTKTGVKTTKVEKRVKVHNTSLPPMIVFPFSCRHFNSFCPPPPPPIPTWGLSWEIGS